MRSEVSLPGPEFVVHQWNAGEGSYVSKGDVIALIRNRSTAPEAVVAKSHFRPRIRGRNSASAGASVPQAAKDQRDVASLTPLLAPSTGLLRLSSSNGGDEQPLSLVLGFIEPCTHPAVIDTMCAVCGQSMLPREDSTPTAYVPSEEEKPAMSQVTVSGGITMQISEAEAMSLSQSQTEGLLEHKRLSLVLDLDHTLVHATADQRASHYDDRDDVRTLLLPTENGMVMHHHVKLRPYLKAFLEQPHYEMTVYTAGTRLYAEQITMVLSRFMVGAELDHFGILQLQSRLKHSEVKLQEILGKRENGLDKTLCADIPTNDGETKSREEGSSPPRKRVRFGKPAPNLKTDDVDITPEDVDGLRSLLKAAEEKENEALELRQKIFGSRIFSRTDVGDLGRDVKSLKRIFPCGGTMSVIVDDREDVWANAEENLKEPPHNLLVVRPYHWKPFAGFADVNNAAGADPTKSRKDEDAQGDSGVETDKQLLWTKDILQRVHKKYYAHEGAMTVSEILQEMRHETLRGCKIIFSGLVPLHKQRDDYDGPRHPLLRYCEAMGATLMAAVDRSITHVVAAADGSEKVVQARRIPGCYIVSSSWLMESLWSLTRRPEIDYILGSPPLPVDPAIAVQGTSSRVRNGVTTFRISNGTDDDDDDDEDDEFADELWED